MALYVLVDGCTTVPCSHNLNDFFQLYLTELLPLLERQLDECPQDARHDPLRQALVILLGTLASHMPQNDPKIRGIVAKLIEQLLASAVRIRLCIARILDAMRRSAVFAGACNSD